MDKQKVNYKDLGIIDYKTAWDYQENLLQENVKLKAINGISAPVSELEHTLVSSCQANQDINDGLKKIQEVALDQLQDFQTTTSHHLILCEHPPVYTLGKSGHIENLLISEAEMERQQIQFFRSNRGGDITFHGPEQVVGYPIIDLEKFYTDIGRYLRELEEVIILTLAEYGISGERSKGETGVWIQPGVPGKERKICALGVRCSRWITMHGFALNVNTDLSYFNNIIPCGIENKQVTSIEKELNLPIDLSEIKMKIQQNFSRVFDVEMVYKEVESDAVK